MKGSSQLGKTTQISVAEDQGVWQKNQKLQEQRLMPVKVSTDTLPGFGRAGISAFILFQRQHEGKCRNVLSRILLEELK